MKNENLLLSREQLNVFTSILVNRILNTNKLVLVKLRNDQLVKITYSSEENFFHTADFKYAWYADGSSFKNPDLDIIEIED